jgi:uracil-DNA glycosylase
VPPQNKLLPVEIAACNPFLAGELRLPGVRCVLAIGGDAHRAVLRAVGLRASALKFVHGARYELPGGVVLTDSYHVSRYNTSTKRLTAAMFEAVVAGVVG